MVDLGDLAQRSLGADRRAMPEPEVLALAYRDTFEGFRPGQAVLADLERKFCVRPPLDGSEASMNRTVIVAAQREVVEHIVRMINRANQVPDNPEGEALAP